MRKNKAVEIAKTAAEWIGYLFIYCYLLFLFIILSLL